MIDRAAAEAALLLLQSGQSQRAVHRQTGISRSTLATIADGSWPGFRRDAVGVPLAEPACRCTGCGALCNPPCLTCETISHLENSPPRPPAPETQIDPAVDLLPPARSRYEKIHAEKVARDPLNQLSGAERCNPS